MTNYLRRLVRTPYALLFAVPIFAGQCFAQHEPNRPGKEYIRLGGRVVSVENYTYPGQVTMSWTNVGNKSVGISIDGGASNPATLFTRADLSEATHSAVATVSSGTVSVRCLSCSPAVSGFTIQSSVHFEIKPYKQVLVEWRVDDSAPAPPALASPSVTSPAPGRIEAKGCVTANVDRVEIREEKTNPQDPLIGRAQLAGQGDCTPDKVSYSLFASWPAGTYNIKTIAIGPAPANLTTTSVKNGVIISPETTPPPANSGCLKLSVSSYDFPYQFGSDRITVTSCGTWTVIASPEWVSVTPSGVSGATLYLDVSTNRGPQRTGTVMIKDASSNQAAITIRQAAGPAITIWPRYASVVKGTAAGSGPTFKAYSSSASTDPVIATWSVDSFVGNISLEDSSTVARYTPPPATSAETRATVRATRSPSTDSASVYLSNTDPPATLVQYVRSDDSPRALFHLRIPSSGNGPNPSIDVHFARSAFDLSPTNSCMFNVSATSVVNVNLRDNPDSTGTSATLNPSGTSLQNSQCRIVTKCTPAAVGCANTIKLGESSYKIPTTYPNFVDVYLTVEFLPGFGGRHPVTITQPNYAPIVALPDFDANWELAKVKTAEVVPAIPALGQTFDVVVEALNSGTTDWGPGHILGWNGTGAGPWGISQVALPSSFVRAGDTARIVFRPKAPDTPGLHPFLWSIRNGAQLVPTTLDPASINQISVQDQENSTLATSTMPPRPAPGQSIEAIITATNTGNMPWRRGEVTLKWASPQANNWGVPNQIELPAGVDIVQPGQTIQFRMTVTTPPGSIPSGQYADYAFVWQLAKSTAFFGAQAGPTLRVYNDAPNGSATDSQITFTNADKTSADVTITVSDPNGPTNIGWVQMIIGPHLDGVAACYIQVNVPDRLFQLVDSGSRAGAPLVNGAGENEQCRISNPAISPFGGNMERISFHVDFKPAFVGPKKVYLYVEDRNNGNTGWLQQNSDWPSAGANQRPTQGSLETATMPDGRLAIRFGASDLNGAANIHQFTAVIVNPQGKQCVVARSVTGRLLWLLNDAGTSFMVRHDVNPLTPTLSNSSCTVGAPEAAENGSDAIVTVPISFAPAFTGPTTLRVQVLDQGGEFAQDDVVKPGWSAAGNASVLVDMPQPTATSMAAGTPFTGQVRFKNTGITTWSEATLHRLGAVNDVTTWRGNNRVALPSPVPPGAVATFDFPATAPSSGYSQSHNFSWRMVHDLVEWFGPTASKSIHVEGTEPKIVSVTPNSGSGRTLTLTTTLSDPQGGADIAEFQILINAGLSAVNACFLRYDRSSNAFYVSADSGSGWLPGSSSAQSGQVIANSQCIIKPAANATPVNGNQLSFTLDITFRGTFSGPVKIYALAWDSAGLYNRPSPNQWEEKGSFNAIPDAAPVTTLDPVPATLSTQTFVIRASDADGLADINTVQMLIGPALDFNTGCYVRYTRSGNTLELRGDDGLWRTGTVGIWSVLENSHCRVFTAASSVQTLTHGLNLSVFIAFTQGANVPVASAYTYADDILSNNVGWVRQREFAISESLPSMSYSGSSRALGSSSIFKLRFSDANGVPDIGWGYFIINAQLNGNDSCFVHYSHWGHRALWLLHDNNIDWVGPIIPGNASTSKSNSRCTIDAVNTRIVENGNNLDIDAAVSFPNPAFAGPTKVWMQVADFGSFSSPWVEVGAFEIVPLHYPYAQLDSPPANLSSHKFVVRAKDDDGAGDIQSVHMIVGNSVADANAVCYVRYEGSLMHLWTGSVWGAVTPGAWGDVRGQHCRLQGAYSSAQTINGELVLTFDIGFNPSYNGPRSVHTYARDMAGRTIGWRKVADLQINSAFTSVQLTGGNSASGPSALVKVKYSDSNGASDIGWGFVIVGDFVQGHDTCYVHYSRYGGNALYLADDTGIHWQGPIVPGTNTSVSNSRCRLAGNQSSITQLGNNDLEVTFDLAFSGSYAGQRKIFVSSQDISTYYFLPWVEAGALTIHNHPPVNSAAFFTGTGTSRRMTVELTDPNGPQDINDFLVMINDTMSAGAACYFQVDARAKSVRILNDMANAYSAWTPFQSGGPIGNTQCALYPGSSSLSVAGGKLTLGLDMSFKPGWGTRNVYVYSNDSAGAAVGWSHLTSVTIP